MSKHLQIGAGSRSRSQAKAEDTARRSRKKDEKRVSIREATDYLGIQREVLTEPYLTDAERDAFWKNRG